MKTSSSGAMPNLLNYLAKGFVLLFALPVLGVWTAGSFICAIIAPIAGILRTFGVSAIGMNLPPPIRSRPFSACPSAWFSRSSFSCPFITPAVCC